MKHSRKGEHNQIWNTAPFFRLLIPLVAGIVTENYLPLHSAFVVSTFFLSLLALIFCNLISFTRFFDRDWMAGIAIHFAILSFGRMIVHIHQDIQIERSSCYSNDRSNFLVLRLLSEPVLRQKSWKAVARITSLYTNGACYIENEKILVYFNENPGALQVSTGAKLLFRKNLKPIQNIKSIDFDYKGYCRLRHIYAQVYLKSNEFVLIGREQEKTVISILDRFRQKMVIVLKNQMPPKSGSGFLEALLFGFTDDLEPEVLKSYADTGVIHIIAISGLHLALICQLLQKILMGPGRRKFVRWFKFFILVGSLWAYSIFSGSSPSVIRSAAMFSLVLFSRNILREAVLYNTLATSAFVLLCFDPNWLWDTGFQLSYAAILGLRLFVAPLQTILQVQNKILKAIWTAASVSIAAQALTTPISIFYFHRFPVYFLFANLLAVPMSSVILLGGILLCIFYWIQPVARLLGWMLDLGIRCLNGIIYYISKLPGSVIQRIDPHLFPN